MFRIATLFALLFVCVADLSADCRNGQCSVSVIRSRSRVLTSDVQTAPAVQVQTTYVQSVPQTVTVRHRGRLRFFH